MTKGDVRAKRRGGRARSASAVIRVRDAVMGEARATRARQLATPSWLSAR